MPEGMAHIAEGEQAMIPAGSHQLRRPSCGWHLQARPLSLEPAVADLVQTAS